MAKKQQTSKHKSALHDILSSVKGIIICSVAALGLFREMPYPTLLFRLMCLWAILSLSTLLIETLFQYLSYRAQAIAVENSNAATGSAILPGGGSA